jgi:PAS domain S-box-containing protein
MDRYEALFELSPIAQEEYDLYGHLVRMNQAARELFGIETEAQMRAVNLFRNPNIPAELLGRLRAGKPIEWDLEYAFDGVTYDTTRVGTLFLHAAIFPFPEGYLLQTLDLTEQRRASQALAESAELHRTLLENLDAGWLLLDSSMRVIEYKDTVTGLVGLPQSRVCGKSILELNPNLGKQEAELQEAFHALMSQGKPIRLENMSFDRIDPGSGRNIVMDIAAFRVLLGGEPHVACFITDATSRQKMQAQLLQGQKMESIGRLASGVAHDFNNLLASILGNASMLEMQPDDPGEVRTCALEIKEASQRAADLTSHMLSFSRRRPPRREPTSIAHCIRNVTSLLERTKSPGIRIDIDVPEDLPPIEADGSQLESVIMNLLVNAVDAMPDGGTLSIQATAVDVDRWRPGTNPAVGVGRWLRLSVSDTGQGMDAVTSSRAFEPFFTTKAPGKGTGLGLYSVYGIVTSHGGQVTLSSEEGEGTTFDLFFPVREMRAARRKQTSMGVPVQGHGTVLVVDDEKIIRQTLATMLSRLGYRALVAEGGRQALEILGNGERVDLVLLDIVMEEMDGAATFQLIRKLERPPHVLLMSGQAEQMSVENLIQGGARGFLSKPFTLRGLSRKVQFALQG